MAKHEQGDPKTLELKRTGTFNPHAEGVTDPLFRESPFFDSRDLLQARYEMLRRHRVEGRSILETAAAFTNCGRLPMTVRTRTVRRGARAPGRSARASRRPQRP